MRPQPLAPNVLRHFYAGGARIAALRGLELESDHMPEEWIGAVSTKFGSPERGLSRFEDGTLVRDAIAADPELGSVVPKLLRPDGEQIDAAGVTVDRRRKNAVVGHGTPAGGYNLPGPAFGGDGAAVLWRRRALEDCAVGAEVLDEDMALWATDVDLAWRARRLGWRCWYEPEALG